MKKTNIHLKELIKNLEKLASKEKVKLWKAIALELKKSTRAKREVNIHSINRNTKDNETIIVPGKVLGTGDIDHKVNVAAFQFSETAKQKINAMSNVQLLDIMKRLIQSEIDISDYEKLDLKLCELHVKITKLEYEVMVKKNIESFYKVCEIDKRLEEIEHQLLTKKRWFK